MKIYISIPISGKDIRKQREKADMIKAYLSRHGHTPVNPFDICAGKNPDYKDHLCRDLRILMDCDAVYFASGWNDSRGCRIEYVTATEFGMTKMFEDSLSVDDRNYYFNI